MDAIVPETVAPGLACFHDCTRRWFLDALESPTNIQRQAWPVLAAGTSALLLAPTGSGKTLAAFLAAIDRLMFTPPLLGKGVRVLYISPLKALAVDVDRNLRAPLAGIQAAARRDGVPFYTPTVAVRSGDTSPADRRQMQRQPPDILITTPESLYLILTSRSRESLATVETVIVDEIHAVAATKRGAHLFLSLERLEALKRARAPGSSPVQRIGLSATQHPLEEVARLLAGADVGVGVGAESPPRPRPVEIVNASEPKRLDLRVETPVEDMARLAQPQEVPSGPTSGPPTLPSIWPAVHARLIELIRSHRSTMVFVNSRRLAERLAAALNDLAGEELAQAHHGSLARARRVEIEDRLKRGQLPAIVATSSMELGIDMGAVDLVVQIEAPPSIASGLQRIGRAGHHVGAASAGVVFPKYRGDLLAASAAVQQMLSGQVEATRYPRNPLDVLAQQIVAMVALDAWTADELYAVVRGAAPFFDLPRSLFDGVLDMLSGRYPSDEFAELRPRITWDRVTGALSSRKSAQRLAILNGGTIPDRGLYSVYLPGEGGAAGTRVGELDEEMVFETHAGDVFLLGASSWRVLEIDRDRVLAAPAPGEPGKMPFWRGEGPGRPLDFGRAIGALTRTLAGLDRRAASERLERHSRLDPQAAANLVNYVADQAAATGELPTDECIVIESFVDELGDWRTVLLSPLGSRVHAPWAIAAAARLRAETGREVDYQWADDGIIFRIPESDRPPAVEWLLPAAEDVEDDVVRELGSTAMFAARFRENAARALLLPRRGPRRRTPLWLQRRKSADLLAVASRYERFPIMLETYRECLRDVFDVPGLRDVLAAVERRQIRIHAVETNRPSPFAGTMLFNYTASFMYQGDAPLAERRAAALALDHAQLRELLGAADYRALLEADVIDAVTLQLQRLDARRTEGPDDIHDLLLHLGDFSTEELAERCPEHASASGELRQWIDDLHAARRIIRVRIGGEPRLAAVEDAARLRDALGVALPPGLPEAFLESGVDPLAELVSRYARTHGPFRAADVAARFGLGEAVVVEALSRLAERGRVTCGEFLPGGAGREWCDVAVLARLKARSLAALRRQIEPTPPEALARFLLVWQGVTRPRRGLDAVLDAVEQLQGAPLLVSALDRSILPARVADYEPSDLDELCSAGEIVWRGLESVGPNDGRVALYLADSLPLLAPQPAPVDDALAHRIDEYLAARGAVFIDEIARDLGGFRNDLVDALWALVWAGRVTNDTLAPLRSRFRGVTGERPDRRHRRRDRFRSRRRQRLPGAEGRWSLLVEQGAASPSPTQRQAALVDQLIRRYGVLVRSVVNREHIDGGFAAIYPVLRAMEEAGRVRRGYFVAGLGGAQFALAGADDLLRRQPQESKPGAGDDVVVLAAADPANAYGALLKWPPTAAAAVQPQRSGGGRVFLLEGALLGYLSRSGNHLLTFPPDDPADAPRRRDRLAAGLAAQANRGESVLVGQVDGQAAGAAPLAADLVRHGFVLTSRGFLHRGHTSDVGGRPSMR